MEKKIKLGIEPYKGVRDFYPEEMFLQKYLFGKMREVAESFGYSEYTASVLEPAELYRAKTGEEIVNEQTYTFTDRGGREVTLRPEMTPTLARMVAKKNRELPYPLRLYSIPNLFRYERMQRGRLREHFQFNADIFGVSSEEAEIEIIILAQRLLFSLGAKEKDFEVRINDRAITNTLFNKFKLEEEQKQTVSKIIDKKAKVSEESFKESLNFILKDKTEEFVALLDSNQKLIKALGEESPEIKKMTSLIENLDDQGVRNVRFDQSLVRGFDYYTGFVFEIYDTDPENTRSLFGGGRYDNLLEVFGQEKMPAVGFGAGDVTMLNFLETRKLLPEYINSTKIYICRTERSVASEVNILADSLRKAGINTAVDLTERKLPDQIRSADKQKIPFVICVGEEEVKSGKYKLKELASGQEKEVGIEEIVSFLKE